MMCSVVPWVLSAHGASSVILAHLQYVGPAGQEAGQAGLLEYVKALARPFGHGRNSEGA